jgi:hypothetical protein
VIQSPFVFQKERGVYGKAVEKKNIYVVHDLYSSPNIIRVIKLRRMRWAGHMARMGRE